MKTFKLVVSSPDGNVFEGDVTAVYVRGADGDLAVLSGHIPFITPIQAGACRLILADGTKKTANTKGGLLTVNNDSVTLLSDSFIFNI